MTQRQYGNQTSGETLGREQEPIGAGERDTTQRRQAEREGAPPLRDPSRPDAAQEDTIPPDENPEAPS